MTEILLYSSVIYLALQLMRLFPVPNHSLCCDFICYFWSYLQLMYNNLFLSSTWKLFTCLWSLFFRLSNHISSSLSSQAVSGLSLIITKCSKVFHNPISYLEWMRVTIQHLYLCIALYVLLQYLIYRFEIKYKCQFKNTHIFPICMFPSFKQAMLCNPQCPNRYVWLLITQ